MKLSKLEIKGFKSFGERVVLNFDDGITGIVGPNGCGKSNVVDAIRWVLGEQKAGTLRSDKMDSVIFNGSASRKQGQLAEVSITFINTKNLLPTAYTEVTVTRRYYRSGESEYLLNGVACRLKDITNLFLDTGIGPDSYAIIELKMVEQILNNKDNSRTELFQEAAGISKFKMRKKETMRKLESADKDLARVDDLLFEIEKNMRSLEKQAKTAEKYFQLKETYKEIGLLYARCKVAGHLTTIASLQSKIDEETQVRTSLINRQNEQEALLEKVKTEILKKEQLLAGRQKTLNEQVNKIRNYESEKKIKNQRLNFLEDKKETLRKQLEEDYKSNERAEVSIKSLREQLHAANKLLAESEVSFDACRRENDSAQEDLMRFKNKVTDITGRLKTKQEELFKLTKSVEINQVQLATLKQELENHTGDDTSRTADLAQFETKINELSALLTGKEKLLEEVRAQRKVQEENVLSVTKVMDELKTGIAATERKLDARKNEYNLTRSMIDNLEGFPEALKFLKKNSPRLKEAPLLSDIVTCDEKFRPAIENFLEPFMNYFIVPDEESAVEAVDILSRAAKGKANFFVVSKFEHYRYGEARAFENAKKATDIVEFDEKYAKLIHFLLDDVYIVTDRQDKLPADDTGIFITQNGQMIKRRYSITGGSVGLFEGKRIGRAKNVEKLEKEIALLGKDLDTYRRELERKQKEIEGYRTDDLTDRIEVLREEVNLLKNDLTSYRTRDEQLRSLINTTAEKREVILERIAALQEEIEVNGPLAASGKGELAEMESQLEDSTLELTEKQEYASVLSARFNELNMETLRQKNKAESIEQELGFKQSSFESSKERIERNTSDLARIDEEIKNLMKTAELGDDDLKALYEEKEAVENGVKEAETEYYAARGSVSETDAKITELRRKRETCAVLIDEMNARLSELKIEMAAITERVKVEFEADLGALDQLQEWNPEHTEETLKPRLDEVKDKLDKIGPVNPMAMEAYNEIKQRYDFYIEQKNDLEKAKASLNDTISEIETKATEDYLVAFEKIRTNFITVFRSLFSEEDSCDLKILNHDNPTESPIEIMAKPKGKKPLSISQLSGGEKTLTAISLLFAIYLLKPAPFCIFDEVDAPLDDTNIDKFNNIIREFSGTSQFIIVTHNKRTMASTDIIYGITMIEKGISTAVPVDLREIA